MPVTKKLPLPEKELPAPHDMLLPDHISGPRAYANPINVTRYKLSTVHWFVLLFIFTLLCGSTVLLLSNNTTQKPIATPVSLSPSPDTTNNWNVYTNTKYKFTLKYPPNLYVADKNSDGYDQAPTSNWIQFCPCPPGNYQLGPGAHAGPIFISVSSVTKAGSVSEDMKKSYPGLPQEFLMIDNVPAVRVSEPAEGDVLIPSEHVYVIYKNIGLFVSLLKEPPYDDPKQKEMFNTFLSTINFLDQLEYIEPSPENAGVVCTMEAKQCSDGSFVGRTGPKCEFTACPEE